MYVVTSVEGVFMLAIYASRTPVKIVTNSTEVRDLKPNEKTIGQLMNDFGVSPRGNGTFTSSPLVAEA